MHYPTIVLELLQDEYPRLHSRLQPSNLLHRAVDDYASWLAGHHESWMSRLSERRGQNDSSRIASDALELAIEDLREDISYSNVAPGGATDQPLSLDAAMAYIRRASRVEKPARRVAPAPAPAAAFDCDEAASTPFPRFHWRSVARTVRTALLGPVTPFRPEAAASC